MAPCLHYSTQPKAARNRKRRGQPQNAADDADTQLVGLHLRQEYPSGLNEVFMDPLAVPSALTLPAMDRALVEAEGRDDGLERTYVCKQGHDGYHQLVRFVRPI